MNPAGAVAACEQAGSPLCSGDICGKWGSLKIASALAACDQLVPICPGLGLPQLSTGSWVPLGPGQIRAGAPQIHGNPVSSDTEGREAVLCGSVPSA